MEKEIKLGHIVLIDDCIADEIQEINNKYNIQTIDTCCGHGLRSGWIVVSEYSTEAMLNLGYERDGYHDVEYHHLCEDKQNRRMTIEGFNRYLKFKPKSICRCKS